MHKCACKSVCTSVCPCAHECADTCVCVCVCVCVCAHEWVLGCVKMVTPNFQSSCTPPLLLRPEARASLSNSHAPNKQKAYTPQAQACINTMHAARSQRATADCQASTHPLRTRTHIHTSTGSTSQQPVLPAVLDGVRVGQRHFGASDCTLIQIRDKGQHQRAHAAAGTITEHTEARDAQWGHRRVHLQLQPCQQTQGLGPWPLRQACF